MAYNHFLKYLVYNEFFKYLAYNDFLKYLVYKEFLKYLVYNEFLKYLVYNDLICLKGACHKNVVNTIGPFMCCQTGLKSKMLNGELSTNES